MHELNQAQLMGLMNLLKESLTFFDKQCYPKITFMNDWCMYQHIREFDIPRVGNKRFYAKIGALLDILEPYIPFRISEENFDLFMEAVLLPEEPSPQFLHKAKMDFCKSVQAIRNLEQWEQTLAVCEAIRALKEELGISERMS